MLIDPDYKGYRIQVFGIELQTERRSQDQTSTVSRVKFPVPLKLPQSS